MRLAGQPWKDGHAQDCHDPFPSLDEAREFIAEEIIWDKANVSDIYEYQIKP